MHYPRFHRLAGEAAGAREHGGAEVMAESQTRPLTTMSNPLLRLLASTSPCRILLPSGCQTCCRIKEAWASCKGAVIRRVVAFLSPIHWAEVRSLYLSTPLTPEHPTPPEASAFPLHALTQLLPSTITSLQPLAAHLKPLCARPCKILETDSESTRRGRMSTMQQVDFSGVGSGHHRGLLPNLPGMEPVRMRNRMDGQITPGSMGMNQSLFSGGDVGPVPGNSWYSGV